jgi:hypothetical protein
VVAPVGRVIGDAALRWAQAGHTDTALIKMMAQVGFHSIA